MATRATATAIAESAARVADDEKDDKGRSRSLTVRALRAWLRMTRKRKRKRKRKIKPKRGASSVRSVGMTGRGDGESETQKAKGRGANREIGGPRKGFGGDLGGDNRERAMLLAGGPDVI